MARTTEGAAATGGAVTAEVKRAALANGELAAQLAALCEQHGATYEYLRDPATGEAVVRLKLANGDVIAGRGADTFDAVQHLTARVGAFLS